STRPLQCSSCQTCGGVCPTGAIRFARRRGRPKPSPANAAPTGLPPLSRRAFVVSALTGAGAAVAIRSPLALAAGPGRRLLRPPGSVAEEQFLDLCIRCGECFKVCPGPMLHPAGLADGVEALWTPVAVPIIAGCHQDCNFCTQVCPTGAITPAGEHVAIDPMVCAGCGSCAALCPSGAISYDAPPVSHLFRRMETLARSYRTAGGQAPRLLVHDAAHGAELIALAARFDRGLPADCLPLALDTIAGFGHAEMLAALALGFGRVDVLLSPRTEREALDRELALARAIAGDARLGLIDDIVDPAALPEALRAARAPAPLDRPILPMGSRRQVTRLAAKALQTQADAPLPLPVPRPTIL
ncbi:hypothetical protein LCGC14_1848000, partial [marine sediment metagenome]